MRKISLEGFKNFFNPEPKAKGPSPVIVAETMIGDFSPDGEFQTFTATLSTLATEYGCSVKSRVKPTLFWPSRTSNFQMNMPQPIMEQILILPGMNQSIRTFKQALENISAELSSPENIQDSVRLIALSSEFSRRIQKVI